MSYQTKIITPLYSFDICPQGKPTGSSRSSTLNSRKAPIFAVYRNEGHRVENNSIKTPTYLIENHVQPWLFRSQWTPLSLSENPQITSSYHDKTPTKQRRIMIQQRLFERFMCVKGSVRYTPSPEPSGSSVKPKLTSDEKELQLTNGLGHGQWRDSVLTKLLGRDMSKPLEWCASYNQWDGYDETYTGRFVKLAWDSRGRCVGGSLMLKSGQDILAIYKPRSSSWEKDGLEKVEDSHGMGSLGIMIDGVSGDALEHIILTCVAIEEQIMRSKGFGGSYHADWSGQ
ncbi:hypothetical protein BU16DRAFT_567784 [Lophium mytilinum]|uniref:Uncharacterized protein n=1 Tax=Lophium mytilinum TaxID=390894 RepID=A0A6A6QBH4_9PEZI|nr:hypothetical protein BU16DRAFT_567784 [Lophium mytilinum]